MDPGLGVEEVRPPMTNQLIPSHTYKDRANCVAHG